MLSTIKFFVFVSLIISILFYGIVSIIVYFRNKKLLNKSLKEIDSQIGDKNV